MKGVLYPAKILILIFLIGCSNNNTSGSRAKAIEEIKKNTRRFSKRQLTWFRRDPRVLWIEGFGSDASVAAAGLEAVRKFLSV